MSNAKLSIAERIRAATIADSIHEGVNIAEGRFGSAMASLCRELEGAQCRYAALATAAKKVAACDLEYGDVVEVPLVDVVALREAVTTDGKP